MLYQVMATVTKTFGKYRSTKGVPTFYLDGDMLGIVSGDHAAKIARGIVNPCDDPSLDVNVHVLELSEVH